MSSSSWSYNSQPTLLIPERILQYSEDYGCSKKTSCVPCKRAHYKCQGERPCKRCIERKNSNHCIGPPKKDFLRFTKYVSTGNESGLKVQSEDHSPCLSWWRRGKMNNLYLFYCTFKFLELCGYQVEDLLHVQTMDQLFYKPPIEIYISLFNSPPSSLSTTMDMITIQGHKKTLSCTAELFIEGDDDRILELIFFYEFPGTHTQISSPITFKETTHNSAPYLSSSPHVYGPNSLEEKKETGSPQKQSTMSISFIIN